MQLQMIPPGVVIVVLHDWPCGHSPPHWLAPATSPQADERAKQPQFATPCASRRVSQDSPCGHSPPHTPAASRPQFFGGGTQLHDATVAAVGVQAVPAGHSPPHCPPVTGPQGGLSFVAGTSTANGAANFTTRAPAS